MQGICDHQRRFTYVDISHPASTSNFLSFGSSSICKLIKSPRFLAPGLLIYGDSVYVNIPVMTSPWKAVSRRKKDTFNFYHSQIRINIECAFGMLVNRWGVLRAPIPMHVNLAWTTSMVLSLCCLHNYLINTQSENTILKPTYSNLLDVVCNGGNLVMDLFSSEENENFDNNLVEEFLDASNHFDDVTPFYC